MTEWLNGFFVLKDLGSNNDTFVNSKRTTEPRQCDKDKTNMGEFFMESRTEGVLSEQKIETRGTNLNGTITIF